MANLSDREIKDILSSYGEDIGPVNAQTRNVYLKQIEKLRGARSNRIVSTKGTTIDRMSDREIKDILSSYGKDIGPVNAQTRSVYLKQIEKLRGGRSNRIGNMKGTTNDRQSTPIFKDSFNPNQSDYREKTIESNFVSPSYSSKGYADAPQLNGSNSRNKWYRGSFRTISSYLGPKENNGLLDISDAEVSDTESTLFTRLRKNYFKKAPEQHSKHSKINSETSSYDYSNLTNIFLFLFIATIVIVFGCYLIFKTRHSNVELEVAMERLICHDGESPSSRCFSPAYLKSLRPYLSRLYEILSDHAGQRVCQLTEDDPDTKMSIQTARETLRYRDRRAGLPPVSEGDWDRLMSLVIALPRERLGLVAYDNRLDPIDHPSLPETVTYLGSLRPRLPLKCRLRLFAVAVVGWLVSVMQWAVVATAVLLFGLCVRMLRVRRRRASERQAEEIATVVEAFCQLLRDRAHLPEPSMSLDAIKVALTGRFPRVRERAFWQVVQDHAFRQEEEILVTETYFQGTTLRWRGGLPAGHAGTEGATGNGEGPTECLKVRNITIDRSTVERDGDRWEEEVRGRLRAVIGGGGGEEVTYVGLVGREDGRCGDRWAVVAYLLCVSREAAGRVCRRLQGRSIGDGNLMAVKFLRRDKFARRFPSIDNN